MSAKNLSKKLKERVAEIPAEGEWWKSGSQSQFESVAYDLVHEFDVSDDDAIDMLTILYYATANCFGG